jgi:Flp pilus assembly protein TadG
MTFRSVESNKLSFDTGSTMKFARSRGTQNSRGQSLVETAIMLPLLVMIVLNVVNFGYFFLVLVNLTGAARTATLYAIEGSSTPAGAQLPGSGPGTTTQSVTYLAFQDMTGALANPTGASVQVCSPININAGSGVNNAGTASQRAHCETCTNLSCGTAGGGSPTPDADPGAPGFILNQVRITYTFRTLIPGTIFNIPLRAAALCQSGSCTFTRQAEMRSMN